MLFVAWRTSVPYGTDRQQVAAAGAALLLLRNGLLSLGSLYLALAASTCCPPARVQTRTGATFLCCSRRCSGSCCCFVSTDEQRIANQSLFRPPLKPHLGGSSSPLDRRDFLPLAIGVCRPHAEVCCPSPLVKCNFRHNHQDEWRDPPTDRMAKLTASSRLLPGIGWRMEARRSNIGHRLSERMIADTRIQLITDVRRSFEQTGCLSYIEVLAAL